jgi:hypothetical protein
LFGTIQSICGKFNTDGDEIRSKEQNGWKKNIDWLFVGPMQMKKTVQNGYFHNMGKRYRLTPKHQWPP